MDNFESCIPPCYFTTIKIPNLRDPIRDESTLRHHSFNDGMENTTTTATGAFSTAATDNDKDKLP